jgi:hypothetical protein
MDLDNAIEICISKGLKIEQFLLMYFLKKRKDRKYGGNDAKDPMYQYIRVRIQKHGPNAIPFFIEDIEEIEEMGYVENFNRPNGPVLPDMFILTPKSASIFATEDMGRQLWDNYPGLIKLKDKGTSFIAKAGEDPEVLISKYLDKIGHSTDKHKFVMEQLDKYKKLLETGKVNGYKISDFVRYEIWNTIAEIEIGDEQFGRDL